jgi:probable rRNA maturation factor
MTSIDTLVAAEGWRNEIPQTEQWAERIFSAAAALVRLDGPVALLLTDDARLKDLNARFRGKDAPTNVLSFPSGGRAAKDGAHVSPAPLGDIAIAFETTRREAAEKGVAFAAHAAHLLVHGLLHLVGFDHGDEREALAMEAREGEILAALGIADPYKAAEPAH